VSPRRQHGTSALTMARCQPPTRRAQRSAVLLIATVALALSPTTTAAARGLLRNTAGKTQLAHLPGHPALVKTGSLMIPGRVGSMSRCFSGAWEEEAPKWDV
jgi:hypothetical protein